MDGNTSLKKSSFWDNAILALTESKRREMALAEFLLELFSKSFEDKKVKVDENSPNDATSGFENELKNEDDDKPLDTLGFIKKKWEMRLKSKL